MITTKILSYYYGSTIINKTQNKANDSYTDKKLKQITTELVVGLSCCFFYFTIIFIGSGSLHCSCNAKNQSKYIFIICKSLIFYFKSQNVYDWIDFSINQHWMENGSNFLQILKYQCHSRLCRYLH